MTDITELAQREKFEAWLEGAEALPWGYLKKRRTSDDTYQEPNTTDMWAAWKAASAELVEALEKAWQRNGELETYSKTALEFRGAARDENRHLKLELEIAEKRIAELEESHAQVIQSRDHYKRMSEEGLKQLAESRTVTVKMPNPHAHLIWIQAGHAPDDYWDDVVVSHSEKDRCCDGSERYPVYTRWEIEEMLTASGIKWEAE
ncbi:hypothetical protein ACUF8H_000273 [Klebsiella aerogenes]